MKLRLLIRRATALLLTAAALLGLGWRPALAPAAEAADVTIDTSKFIDPNDSKTTGYIYYWRSGAPTVDWTLQKLEEDGLEPNFKNYPVLLTWDNKYYLYIDQNFVDTFEDRYGDNDHLS